MKHPPTIVFADAHQIVRAGYVSILKIQTDYQVIGEAEDGIYLLELLKTCKPDILFLEIDMPRMNGDETIDRVTRLYPDIKVIMLSMHYSPLMVTHFFLKGARAYLSKGCDAELLISSIEQVHNEGYSFNAFISRKQLNELMQSKKSKLIIDKIKLSEQELQFLKLIHKEKTYNQAAEIMNVSYHTVDYYRRSIFLKTRQRTAAGLIKFAIQNGLHLLK